MMNDRRFKVDEIFSNLVENEPRTIILLMHNKRYVYTVGSKQVLIYYSGTFGFLHYTIVPVHHDCVKWEHCKIVMRTINDTIHDIYSEYKREG